MLVFALGFISNAAIFRVDYSRSTGFSKRSNRPSLDSFWNVYNLINKTYDGKIDKDKYMEGAIKGAVASIGDPYTVYLDTESAKALSDELSGTLSGVGIEIGKQNDKLTIIAPIDDTPAARVGLKAGDLIAAIDGNDASGYSVDEAAAKIRGPKGTNVKLVIVRGGNVKEYEITRDTINVKSVSSEIKNGNIGYMKIRQFGDSTPEEAKTAVTQFKAKGVKAIILDLRNNPGGYLQGAVEIVSLFQNDGTIVSEKGKDKSANQSYTADGTAIIPEVPIIILTNNGTASASEITAGALRDKRSAILIGEKTFGKGVVQDITKLGGGREVKITIARWYTPKGVNISKAGLTPDINVKLTDVDYNAGRDPQLERALSEAAAKIQ